ncbi:MAG TPA: hypothetical protein VGE85_01515 [Terracidiphilus sp.]|jgi:hypothetical protein
MAISNLPKRLAVVGMLVGCVLMIIYWYDYELNPFHLPTVTDATGHPGLSVPLWYLVARKVMFALCPGLYLQVFTLDTGIWIALVMWAIAVLLNGLIYYLVGFAFVAALKSVTRTRDV